MNIPDNLVQFAGQWVQQLPVLLLDNNSTGDRSTSLIIHLMPLLFNSIERHLRESRTNSVLSGLCFRVLLVVDLISNKELVP